MKLHPARTRRWLGLTTLEDRFAPAVVLWQGNGAGNPNNWSNANNWAGGKLPLADDVARFDTNNVSVVVDTAQSVAGVELTTSWSSPFTLSAPLSTSGPSLWNNGSIGGTSTWTNLGIVTIGAFPVSLSGGSIVNKGTINHTTTNTLNVNSPATFTNETTGIYDFKNDAFLGNNATVTNKGLIRKTAGTGESWVRGIINSNNGTWDASIGILRNGNNGGLYNGLTLKTSNGAGMDVCPAGYTSNWAGVVVCQGDGGGMSGGTNNIDNAGVTFTSVAGSPFYWQGGTTSVVSGNSTLTNNGTIVFSFNGFQRFSGVGLTISNFGTFRQEIPADVSITLSSEVKFVNETTGIYDFTNNGGIVSSGGGMPTFTNKGLVRKSGGLSGTSIQARINSEPTGIWESSAGTLTLQNNNGTYNGGTWRTFNGASLDMNPGFAGSTWTGKFICDAGGPYVSGGTVTIGNAGATLSGPAPFHLLAGAFNAQVGGAKITNTGTIIFSFTTVTFNEVSFSNSGSMIQQTSMNADVVYGGGLNFVNEPGGIYEFKNDSNFIYSSGSSPSFTNKGLIRKSGGSGTSSLPNINFINSGGVIDVQTGTFVIPANYSTNKGGFLGKGTLQSPLNNSDGFVRPGPVSGTLTVNGNYTQGSNALFIPEMKGTTAADFSLLSVNGEVALGGLIIPVVNYTAKINDSFTVLLNDGTDPIVGAFVNAPEGGTFTVKGTTFHITYKGGTGNDVVLKVTNVAAAPVTPPKVTLVAPNGGGAQRSRVTGLLVQYDQSVSQAGSIAAAYQLKRSGDNANVILSGFESTYWNSLFTSYGITPIGGDFAYLTFDGGPLDSGSLADGLYTLTIAANQISNANGQLDGNANGTGGDNYILVGNPATNKLFRLFGDADGNGTVNATDFAAFRGFFGSSGPSMFDFNNDGQVNATDFAQFRGRFGITLQP